MRLAGVLALVLLSTAVAQTGNENHCPRGQVWSKRSDFIDAPEGCVTPPPADHYTQSPCWGNKKMLTILDPKGCTFWIDGEQIGWLRDGKMHLFKGKWSHACQGRVLNDCVAAEISKDIRKEWGLE